MKPVKPRNPKPQHMKPVSDPMTSRKTETVASQPQIRTADHGKNLGRYLHKKKA